jgi:hypothetical protein
MLPDEAGPEYRSAQPLVYQIRIRGQLSQQWTNWFDGLSILLEEDGNTILEGPVVDQAALHGILKKIRNLGMPLLSVNSRGPASQDKNQMAHE